MSDESRSEVDEDTIDIQPWPVIELIGRGVTLATVARRGILEVDSERDEFDLETDRFDLSTWARTELQNWISDDELRILNASVGDLSDNDLSTCDDALVSATAIVWAIRALDAAHLPLPEDEALNEATLRWAPEPWNKVRALQSKARLRTDDELAAERERWELWYWRSTDGVEDPDAVSDVVEEVRESGLIAIADGDFANDAGTPFTRLSAEEMDDAAWLSGLRLKTLNWVCGFGESWESAPLYLDD